MEKIGPTPRKALFLDRDGTIIEDRGNLGSPSQVAFFNETFSALRQAAHDYLLFIITNQQCIAEGAVSRQQVDQVNRHVVQVLKKEGVPIREVYVCPHTKEDMCGCRKPRPYFLHKARQDYQLDLSSSFVVGDHPSDVLCATSAGAQGIYVLTGHGKKHRPELAPNTLIVQGIDDAIAYILKQ